MRPGANGERRHADAQRGGIIGIVDLDFFAVLFDYDFFNWTTFNVRQCHFVRSRIFLLHIRHSPCLVALL